MDQIAKLLELQPEDVYRMPIPVVNSLVAARIANLKEARYKAEHDGEITPYTEKDYYGSKGLVSVINQLFGGSGKDDSTKRHGARNVSSNRGYDT